ncbi:MAG TPA: hypothetical protein VIX80_06785 [Candidatus Kapabacteria bacterium]
MNSIKHSIRRRANITTPIGGYYDAKLDGKRRIVIRSAQYEHYSVYEREDGSVILVPKVLVDVPLSNETLALIGSSIKNFKKGKVSEAIDIDKYLPKKRAK